MSGGGVCEPRSGGRVGIYGWRKRCLYAFILLLLVTVIINLALTIWVLRVLDFNLHGMGNLRLVDGGVRIDGDTEFLKTLYAARIKAKKGGALYLESGQNITVNVRGSDGTVTEQLYLGGHRVVAYAREFEVRNRHGDMLFAANSAGVELGGKKALSFSDSGGAVFSGSVQTPLVSTDTDHLRLESLTRRLLLYGADGVRIDSPGGRVVVSSLGDITLRSRRKAIRLDARSIELRNLAVSRPTTDGRTYPEVYQVCVCGGNGRLYVAPSSGNCSASHDFCS